MHHLMAKFWWILGARGVLGILLGLSAFWWIFGLDQAIDGLLGLSVFVRPGALLLSLVFFLGLYAFLDGLFAITLGAQDYGDGRRWWALILEGLLSVSLGLLIWFSPRTTILVVLYWIAVWAILTGTLEIFQGFDLNEYKERRRPFFFMGLYSVVFGLIILYPGAGGETLVWLIGTYALLAGIPLLVLGLRLRHYVHHSHRGHKSPWVFGLGLHLFSR